MAKNYTTMRTSIYVDGFNLFYRTLKKTPYKWLDLKSLFTKILDDRNEINAIKYFTARVSGKWDPKSPIRQQAYLRALQAYIPEISIIYGHFLTHKIMMPLANPTIGTKRYVKVIKTEEKASDVNIAVHLLNDAWLDRYDCAIIVSNDSDLAEAVKIVKNELKKTIGVIMPGNGTPSKELIQYANFVKKIRQKALSSSQLPDHIPNTTIRKPSVW
jgi:uncharacterized LabA/DUF88 family protein